MDKTNEKDVVIKAPPGEAEAKGFPPEVKTVSFKKFWEVNWCLLVPTLSHRSFAAIWDDMYLQPAY